MIGHTMGFYLARHFLRNTLFVFLIFFFLIALVDMLELSRRTARIEDVDFLDLAGIAFLRAPVLAENIVPFAVLFGSAASLLLLNRRLELVVARASGVSVWQFLAPIALSAAFVGLAVALVYNPLSLTMQASSLAIEGDVFSRKRGADLTSGEPFRSRIGRPEGDMIITAAVSTEQGRKLSGVSAQLFTQEGKPLRRIDAATATFDESGGRNRYILRDATVLTVGEQPEAVDEISLPVTISAQMLRLRQTRAERVSIWDLGQQAKLAKAAARPTGPFITRWHALMALPLLFVAMVFVAATVSLTFARFGVDGRRILTGIVAGFVLYVGTKLVVTFGSNGLVSPAVAAWSPALVGSLIAITVLLHQEDG